MTPGSVSGTQTICSGDTPAVLTSAAPTGDGLLTVQWQSSTDGTTFTGIAGANGATYAPGPLTADTWYRILVTSTMGTVCTDSTNIIKVTVNNFVPGSIGTDQTICENTPPLSLTSVTPTGDGTFTYRWYSSSDGITFGLIAGVGETYSPGVLTADTWYRRQVTSTLSGKACSDTTNRVRITVNNMTPAQ